MQFEFKNLGTIKEAQIEMGDLTIICGENNTGKTYLTYAVWGIYANVDYQPTKEEMISFSKDEPTLKEKYSIDIKEAKNQIKKFGKYSLNIDKEDYLLIRQMAFRFYEKSIEKVFGVQDDYFSNLRLNIVSVIPNIKRKGEVGGLNVEIEISDTPSLHIKADKEYFDSEQKLFKNTTDKEFPFSLQLLLFFPIIMFIERFKYISSNLFLLPAQRDSIELFYKALDEHSTHTLKELQRTKDMSLLEESPRFPQPIEKLIDFARDLTRQVIKTKSFIQTDHPELLQEIEEILGVKYEVLGDEVVIKDGSAQLPAYMASTSVRSLMHLYFWLKHKAQKGDLLMIDEPELNLHPKNQIKMARLFAKLINVGVKIWITTHSDYIIKELNNCLMLSQDFDDKEETLNRLGYKSNEVLEQKQVKAYIAKYDENLKGCTVVPVEYDEYGMVMTTFDEQIDKINAISEELSDAIYEKKLSKTQEIN